MRKFGYLGPILMAITMLFVSPLSADEMNDYDLCLIGKTDVKECNDKYRVQSTATVDQDIDSVDYIPTDASFRFAGAGLEVKQIGDPYYVAMGDPTWSGDDGCQKTQEMVLKAVFKREDGVQTELPVLDADGKMTTKLVGPVDACKAVVTWDEPVNSRWGVSFGYGNDSSLGGSEGGRYYGPSARCGTGSAVNRRWYQAGSDGDTLCRSRSVVAANHCSYTTAVATRQTVREDGEVVGASEQKTCTLVNSAPSVYTSTPDRSCDSTARYRAPGYAPYLTMTFTAKSDCMNSWGWFE